VWDDVARRLVDAQACTLARRVWELASIPGRGAGWPARLLEEYALLRLLTTAFERRGALPEPLHATVRSQVGFTVGQEEVLAGEKIRDHSTESVAAFYASFCDAAAELGIRRPGSSLICEIPDAPPSFEDDPVERSWDRHAARLIWAALNLAADGLETWQAPFRGHRPRVGVMWGGFDLSATRYRPQPAAPPPNRPAFMQNAQVEEYVSVGFSFGSSEAPDAGMYAYIWPQPEGLEGRSWGVDGAAWHPDAGLVLLPWATLRETADPHQARPLWRSVTPSTRQPSRRQAGRPTSSGPAAMVGT
jgi:hypothetical protein